MAFYPYIRLVSHDGTLDKRFRVFLTGFVPSRVRTQAVTETVGGGVDVQQGAFSYSWSFMIRVLETEPNSLYGNRANLETFFGYKYYPADQITFYDHYGVSHTVYIVGNYEPQPNMPDWSSASMYWSVPIILRETTAA